jgi:hypothetical protein
MTLQLRVSAWLQDANWLASICPAGAARAACVYTAAVGNLVRAYSMCDMRCQQQSCHTPEHHLHKLELCSVPVQLDWLHQG